MDTILYGGVIRTMDPDRPLAQALRISNGRFADVGNDASVLAAARPEDRLIDLKGAAVYPGMIDSHLHILNLAVTERNLVLNEFRSREAVLLAVSGRAQTLPKGSLIEGRGFNEDLWTDPRLIDRHDLDIAAPDHAVILSRVCGHMVVANSLTIRLAGVDETTPVPDGAEIDLERGFFSENAIALLWPKEKDGGVELCKTLLFEGMSRAADAGLTGIWSDDFFTDGFSMHTVAEAYRELEAEGRMPLRVVQQCALADDKLFQAFLDAGYRYFQGSDLYRFGPRKLYADGSLGARTAWLSVPYADAPDRTGVPIYTQDEMNRLAEQSHRAGMPFIVHAIGDAAADCVLDAVAHARRAVPGTDGLPDGIVHCQITRSEQLARIAEMGVRVYAQPVFTEYDLHICRKRAGEALEKTSYNWATLLRSGVNLSSGSDCPVEPLDPALNIYCAVTRKDFDRCPAGGWLPEQRLTVDEAIRCHTLEAAKAVGYEDRLGQIRPGYLADLTVFPKDLAEIASDKIMAQKPLFTVVGGVIRLCPGTGSDRKDELV